MRIGVDAKKNYFETAEEKTYQNFLSNYSVYVATDNHPYPYYFKCTNVTMNNDTKLIRSISFELP